MAQERNPIFAPRAWTNGMGVAANAHPAGFCDAPFLEFPNDAPE